jgi:MFS family permease
MAGWQCCRAGFKRRLTGETSRDCHTTFATGFAGSPDALLAMRFISGMAIGGLLAPAWAINIESMPAGKKATAVTIIMLGFSAGGAMAGQVTNWLAPNYGWEGVFFFAGATTMVLAVVLLFTMPESLRWLAAKGRAPSRIEPLVRQFDPTLRAGAYAAFTLSDERSVDRESPWAKFAELFRGHPYLPKRFPALMVCAVGTLYASDLGADPTGKDTAEEVDKKVAEILAVF